MKERGFLSGAVILGISAMFVRFIGFLFRIYLSNALGAQGMGVYSLIMSVYGFSCTLATAGIAVAVSRLVAEQVSLGKEANAARVLKRAVVLTAALGSVVGVTLFFLSDFIAGRVLSDMRTAVSLRMLAAGIPFLSMCSCFRGYFIARRKVGNPASGQVLEQLFKIAFIMSLLGRAIPHGIEYSCAVVVMGIAAGEIMCFFYTFAGYLLQRRKERTGKKADIRGVTGKILEIVLPISVTAYIRSSLRMVEDVLIMRGLKSYSGNHDSATGTYGMLKGMAMPLLLFPLSLMSSFVITLTPEISRLRAREEYKRLEHAISRILQYTCSASLLIVCVFMTFSKELGIFVYKTEEVGALLWQLSFLCPFMCLESVTVSILQGLGEEKSSAAYNLMDCALRIAMIWGLIPSHGVPGFLWMVVASNLFTSVLNLRRLLKIVRVRFRFNDWVARPAIAAMASSQIVKAAYHYLLAQPLKNWQSLVIGVMVACISYLLLLFSIGCFKNDDIQWVKKKLFSNPKQPKVEKEHAF